jgi:WD40 repeat protein
MESTQMSWRKSSYSSNGGGDCLETASRNGTVLVRDTKDNGRGQVHSFTGDEWRVFLVGIKAETKTYR